MPSAAANSSNITSMPQVDRGGLHADYMGNEVVKCSTWYLRQRLADTGPHRGRLRRIQKCSVWAQVLAAGKAIDAAGKRRARRNVVAVTRHGRRRVYC